MSEVEKKMHLHLIERESLEQAGKDLFVSMITNDHIPPFEHQTLVLELCQTIMHLRPLHPVLPPIKKPPAMTCHH